MQLSIVIPLYNEQNSIKELNETIEKVVSAMGIKYEIIYIDDGSNDNSWNVIKDLAKEYDQNKGNKIP